MRKPNRDLWQLEKNDPEGSFGTHRGSRGSVGASLGGLAIALDCHWAFATGVVASRQIGPEEGGAWSIEAEDKRSQSPAAR